MSVRFLFCIAALILVVLAPAAVAENLLVLKDGSSLEVETMTVRGGRVEVRLPDSNQSVAYSVSDVDLEASGLAPRRQRPPIPPTRNWSEAVSMPPSRRRQTTRMGDDHRSGRRARAPTTKRTRTKARPRHPPGSPRCSSPTCSARFCPSGPLTVTGRVTNSGNVPVSAISITGDAEDGDGASLGRGTTGISSALDAGEAAEFSIAIPVSGAVANVKVSAIAAVSEFTFEQVAAPQADGEEEDEGFDEPIRGGSPKKISKRTSRTSPTAISTTRAEQYYECRQAGAPNGAPVFSVTTKLRGRLGLESGDE